MENKMKKYLYLLFVAFLATMPFAITSCGDDEDEPNSTTGKYELTINNKKYSFNKALPNGSAYDYTCIVSNNNDMLTFSIYNWDKVVTGTALTNKNFNLGWNSDKAVIGFPTSNTTVKVTAKDNQFVTISFKNAKFEDLTGSELFTVNGTVKLPLK